MDTDVIILGTYCPLVWRASVIGPWLCSFTRLHGLVPHYSPPMLKIMEKCSWKSYEQHASVVRFAHPEYEGNEWHQDGDRAPGADMDCALVVWCDRVPTTEIRHRESGLIQSPKPFQIVMFNNLEFYHRRPPYAEGKRWLFRQRVQRLEPS